jgi:hypothetical protein
VVRITPRAGTRRRRSPALHGEDVGPGGAPDVGQIGGGPAFHAGPLFHPTDAGDGECHFRDLARRHGSRQTVTAVHGAVAGDIEQPDG